MELRIKVEAVFENGRIQEHELGSWTRSSKTLNPEALGLLLEDAHSIPSSLQNIAVTTQVQEISETTRACPSCSKIRHIHDYRTRKLDTLFGKVAVKAPRLKPCKCDDFSNSKISSLSWLTAVLPGRITPERGGRIRRVFADGASDGQPTYDAIYDASPPKSKPKVIINPREPSIPDKGAAHGGLQRELHAARIAEVGQIGWQRETEYGLRSKGEVAIGRVKSLMNGRLTARTFGAQQAEVAIKIAIANKSVRAAKPVMERVQ